MNAIVSGVWLAFQSKLLVFVKDGSTNGANGGSCKLLSKQISAEKRIRNEKQIKQCTLEASKCMME